jgi:hypothetical protein
VISERSTTYNQLVYYSKELEKIKAKESEKGKGKGTGSSRGSR